MFQKRTKIVDGVILEDKSLEELRYADCHGCGADSTLPLIFELAKFIKPQIIVVIGSGDGLIPRLLREAQAQDAKLYLIDLGETMGALPEKIHNPNAEFRILYPEIVVIKGYSVPDGIDYLRSVGVTSIDLLWIDGDHSHKGSKLDFDHYSPFLSTDGLIFLHDTAPHGAGKRQPNWCGVDKTVHYIRTLRDFEVLNFTPTNHLKLGTGFAIVKRARS
jgi:predicted O-methyltransferase YrrM